MIARGRQVLAHRSSPRRGGLAGAAGVLLALGASTTACMAPVPSAASSLRVASVRFEESVAVSTDGVPGPGERGALRITLSNAGDVPQSGVTGSIRVVGPPGVTVPGPATSWPDVAPRSCAPDAGSLLVDLEAAVPCAGSLDLQLEVTSAPDGVQLLPLRLPIGRGSAGALAPLPVDGQRSSHASVAWNGVEFGVAWSWPDGSLSRFARLDGSGALLALPESFPGATLALAHGGGRWAVARIQGGRLKLRLLDAAGVPTESDLGALPGVSIGAPAIAWDGTGWSLAVLVRLAGRIGALHFVHATPEGAADATPAPWSSGEELFGSPQMIWTGSDLALLLSGAVGSRLAFVSPAGLVQHVSGRVAQDLSLPVLAWNGRVFALAGWNVSAPRAVVLDGCGEPLTPTQPLDAWDEPDVAQGRWTWVDGAPAMSAEPGGVFGLAVSRRALVGGFGSEDQWVELHRFDENAHVVSAPARITPRGSERWAASSGATWREDVGQHVVAVVHDPDWTNAVSAVGALALARSPVLGRCPAGEPPREVSPSGSSLPLLARKRLRRACGLCETYADVVLSVEDLGAEAASYNVVAADDPATGFAPSWVSCHRAIGGNPGATPVAGGRIELEVIATESIEDARWRPRNFVAFRVSASNAGGEGPLGSDSEGRPVPVTNACLDDPR